MWSADRGGLLGDILKPFSLFFGSYVIVTRPVRQGRLMLALEEVLAMQLDELESPLPVENRPKTLSTKPAAQYASPTPGDMAAADGTRKPFTLPLTVPGALDDKGPRSSRSQIQIGFSGLRVANDSSGNEASSGGGPIRRKDSDHSLSSDKTGGARNDLSESQRLLQSFQSGGSVSVGHSTLRPAQVRVPFGVSPTPPVAVVVSRFPLCTPFRCLQFEHALPVVCRRSSRPLRALRMPMDGTACGSSWQRTMRST